MTIFANFRQSTVAGGVKDPSFLEGNGTVANPQLKALSVEALTARIGNRDALFAIHGFNVSFAEGVCSLSRLETILALPSTCQFIAVLWPGDSWLPVVNYPFEGSTSIDCGHRLADFCNRKLNRAASISFVTHSLGARVALEATRNLSRKTRLACLAAAAINDDCLTAQYADAAANSSAVALLDSRRDLVLKLAYPIGDPIADLLHFDHKPFRLALGLQGPPPPIGDSVRSSQIPDISNYDHGDYLPPGDPAVAFLPGSGKWIDVAGFVSRAFNGLPQTWP